MTREDALIDAALASEIADEQIRHWHWRHGIRARQAWDAMGLPPSSYVNWPMVRREMIRYLLSRNAPALLAA